MYSLNYTSNTVCENVRDYLSNSRYATQKLVKANAIHNASFEWEYEGVWVGEDEGEGEDEDEGEGEDEDEDEGEDKGEGESASKSEYKTIDCTSYFQRNRVLSLADARHVTVRKFQYWTRPDYGFRQPFCLQKNSERKLWKAAKIERI